LTIVSQPSLERDRTASERKRGGGLKLKSERKSPKFEGGAKIKGKLRSNVCVQEVDQVLFSKREGAK